jgi:hypothetical protein
MGAKPTDRTIHYTELAPSAPGALLFDEWNLYLRELPRLLAEGLEGQFVLIKGQEIVGLYPSFREAIQAGYARFLRQPFLAQQILEWEPIHNVRGVV